MRHIVKRSDSIVKDGVKLYRVVADEACPSIGVKKGDLGGYISLDTNLGWEGTCWVYDGSYAISSEIRDNALVKGASFVKNSEVKGHAVVKENSYIINSKILDNSLVDSSNVRNSVVSGKGVVKHSLIENGACISGEARVHTYIGSEYDLQPDEISGTSVVSGNVIITGCVEVLGGEIMVNEDEPLIIGDYVCLINAGISKPSDLKMLRYYERDRRCEYEYTDMHGKKFNATSDTEGILSKEPIEE